MKFILLSMVLLQAYFLNAQVRMSDQERNLRATGDFTAFLKEVKTNSKENCLCLQNEWVIFSFQTDSKKTASLCISKKIGVAEGYMTYYFGTKKKIEFSYPADTVNSFSKFSFFFYMRGGGKQNEAMELNKLNFSNKNFTYTLYDDYYSEDKSHQKGITITNDSTGKKVFIKAKGKTTGNLNRFREKNIVMAREEE